MTRAEAPELHYVVDGCTEQDAPALLLIHPIGASLEVWEPVLPALQQRFRVIRYDQRGHGLSHATPGPYTVEALARDALGILDKLGIERAAVCGSSLGGMLAMWLGVHAKERVSRLALLCTSAKLGTPEGWRERAALVRATGLAGQIQAVSARWFTSEFVARSPELILRLEQMVEGTSREAYASCCEAIADWDIRAELAQVEAPTWILAGGADPATSPAHAYAIGAAIPNARVTVIEQAAHLAFAEQPARVAQLLLDHLAPVGALAETDRERAAAGNRTRRAVLGDAHVDRAQANTTEFTAPFQDFITRYAWGEIWSRPGLARAERSLITLSVLAALRAEEELAMHVRAALRNGLTPDQIRETLLQVAIYAGVPAANRAFAIAQKVLNEG